MKEFDNYLEILELTELFNGIKTSKIISILNCLGTWIQSLEKGNLILLTGDCAPKGAGAAKAAGAVKAACAENIGIVLSGQLHIIRENYNGNRSLMASIKQGGLFAEALCCNESFAANADILQNPITVTAAESSIVLMLKFSRVIKICSASCSFHIKLIENMLGIIEKKNLMLQSRMEILELKTIREKVMCYLESFKVKHITLPFNREEMADYLCVERSALSHELIKMKNDWLIDYKKNNFTILENNDKMLI